MIELLFKAIAGRGADHRALFLRNELRTVLGKGNKNLKTLAYFTLLAFIAVVFAEAGWKYLGKRMDNPYVKWIDFPVSSDVDSQYRAIIHDLDSLKSLQRFTLDRHSGFNRYILGFRRADGRVTDKVKGRTFISPEDNSLLAAILNEQNVLRMNAPGNDPSTWTDTQKKTGIFITEELVRMMKFDADQDTLYAQYGKDHYLQLRVIAVVKSLPDRAMFMSSYEMFWDLARSAGTEFDFYNNYRQTDQLQFLVKMDDAQFDTKAAKVQLDQLVQEQGYDLQVKNILLQQLPVLQGPFTINALRSTASEPYFTRGCGQSTSSAFFTQPNLEPPCVTSTPSLLSLMTVSMVPMRGRAVFFFFPFIILINAHIRSIGEGMPLLVGGIAAMNLSSLIINPVIQLNHFFPHTISRMEQFTGQLKLCTD